MGDVTVVAPVAYLVGRAQLPAGRVQLPSDEATSEDLIRWQAIALAEAERKVRELGEACSMISSIALGLLKLHIDCGYASERNEVTIPRWLHEQMLGASITFTHTPDGIVVKLRERGSHRIEEAR